MVSPRIVLDRQLLYLRVSVASLQTRSWNVSEITSLTLALIHAHMEPTHSVAEAANT